MHGPTTYNYKCVYIYIYIYFVKPFFKQLHLKERVNHKFLIVINNIILHYLLKKKKKKKRSHTSLILLMFDDLDGNPSNYNEEKCYMTTTFS